MPPSFLELFWKRRKQKFSIGDRVRINQDIIYDNGHAEYSVRPQELHITKGSTARIITFEEYCNDTWHLRADHLQWIQYARKKEPCYFVMMETVQPPDPELARSGVCIDYALAPGESFFVTREFVDYLTGIPYVETQRLILRTVTEEEVDAVASSWNLEGPPLSREEAEKQVARMLENHARNTRGKIYHLCLAIIRKDTGRIIGWCGLDHRDPSWPNPALFYLIRKAEWGQGYATEAARALVRYAFQALNIPVIDASCFADNLASKRVMEKIGMRYLGKNARGEHAFTMRRNEAQRAAR